MNENQLYRDRHEAGQRLASHLRHQSIDSETVVVALARGGVPVALEVALAFAAPLDVLVVCKLWLPCDPRVAMGGIAAGGCEVLNERLLARQPVSPFTIAAVADRARIDLRRREASYRGDLPPLDVNGRTVLLVDDSLATGLTMRAALQALRQQRPRRIIIAVPVGYAATCDELAAETDRLFCPVRLPWVEAVSRYYGEGETVTDEQVRHCLDAAGLAGMSRESAFRE